MQSCYLYRLPGGSAYHCGAMIQDAADSDMWDEETDVQLEKGCGFIFSGFSLYPQIRFIRRDSEIELIDFDKNARDNDRLYSMSPLYFKGETTLRDDHLHYIDILKRRISEIESQSKKACKIIAARIKMVDTQLSASEIFLSLCKAYPSAFVYAFSTPQTGTWIGATPETLLWATDALSLTDKNLTRAPGMIETMSLAGTRRVTPSDTDTPWGTKEIEEQKIVTDFIAETLSLNGYNPIIGTPETKKCGPVEHISTSISAARFTHNKQEIINLLRTLSPTPALCGYPRALAIQEISAHEEYSREYYGGLVGYSMPACDAARKMESYSLRAFANLRCGYFNSNEGWLRLYAGGGITRDSDPEAEWEETEAKLKTMERGVGF